MAVKSPSLAPRHVYRKVEMCGQQTCAHSQVPETICQDGAQRLRLSAKRPRYCFDCIHYDSCGGARRL